MAHIEARGLGKSYGGRVAVADLSFDVRPGVVTGFLGPNGSGKSTTMRLMLGLDRGEGRTTYDGRSFGELPDPMRHVGALLEAKPFHPTRTARNHLRMLAVANRIPDTRVDEVLAMVGLGDVARHRPGSFSLGMGQRLGIAAALLGDPHSLVLDEPSNGLDPQGIRWLRTLLRQLAGEGRSVLVSSHLLQEMSLLADELVVVGRGRLLGHGPVDAFLRSSARSSVVVRSPDMRLLGPRLEAIGGVVVAEGEEWAVRGLDATRIGDAAHDVGARLHGLVPREATLEEAFMDATGYSQDYIGQPRVPPPVHGPPVPPGGTDPGGHR